MTQEAFEAEVTRLTETMYHLSCALLRRVQDRQDAVQSAILKAWQHKDRLRDEGKFKHIATYGEFFTEFHEELKWEDSEQQGSSIGFEVEMLDDQGKTVTRLRETITGTVGSAWRNSQWMDIYQYTAWWPAVKEIPKSIKIQAMNTDTGEILAVLDVPLEAVSQAASGT